MSEIIVRLAHLNDTQAIGGLHQKRIETWQRVNSEGQVENIPYAQLNIYERWLHGGPWMSVETSAIHLNHLLQNNIPALVAMRDGQVIGYVEAYTGREPAPYNSLIHIGSLVTADDANDGQAVKDALMERLIETAKQEGYAQLTAAFSTYDRDSLAYYRRFAMHQIKRIVRYTLPAQPGQTFYKATSHADSRYEQIAGWGMPVGRMQSARQHWETLWPQLWAALPEKQRDQRTHRLYIDAAGQKALLCCQQQLYDPRSADIYCWSPNPLSAQLLTAIRDWTHRQGYRTLNFAIPEDAVKLLGPEAENTPYQQDIYGVQVDQL